MKLSLDKNPPSGFMMLPIVTTFSTFFSSSVLLRMLLSSVETTAPPCEYPKTTTGAFAAISALFRFVTPLPTETFQVSHVSPGHQLLYGIGQNVAGYSIPSSPGIAGSPVRLTGQLELLLHVVP